MLRPSIAHRALPLLPVLALAAALLGSCGASQQLPASSPVLLVGVDGFEWDVILPLMTAGELPQLASLVERGRAGLLETTRPTFSPIIWTTIATGKPPDEHGIRGFVHKTETGERRLYNSHDRKTKAFWNIASEAGRSVAVIGWWMTYPAEPVNGLLVAQVNTLDQADRRQGRAIIKGGLLEDAPEQVFPGDRMAAVLATHREVTERLPELNRSTFGEFAHPLTPLTQRLWDNTQWAFRSDATYLEVAEEAATEGHDLLAVYLGGTDVAGHRFWRHMQPELYADSPPAHEVEDLGELIAAYYRYVDRAIGRLLEAMPGDPNVIVVSDHGMHAVNRGKTFRPDDLPNDLNSGHHRDAPPGVLIAAGPQVVTARPGLPVDRASLETGSTILDVTPTLLALLELPAGRDMAGRVLTELLHADLPIRKPVATHDTRGWRAAREQLRPERLESDEERLEQLRSLGYIN